MMSIWKRICSIGLVLCLLSVLVPMAALAAEPDFLDSRAAVVQQLRAGLGAHEAEITVYYKSAEQLAEGDLKALFTEAVEYDSVWGGPMTYLGDYLVFSVAAVKINAEYDEQDGMYYYKIPYAVTYFNSAEQEKLLRDAVALATETMLAESHNDYERCKWIYDQMRANVAGGADPADWLGSTAYGALVEGKANSQGMAALFYVMASDAGLNVRIVTGTVNGMPCAWNIVRLYDRWYMMDVHEGLFLGGSASAQNHVLDAYYESPAFALKHAMAESAYTPEAALGGTLENGKWSYNANTKTLTISGQGPMQDFAGTQTPTGQIAVSRPWDACMDEVE